MAIPPPPYANISGTSQVVAKYNFQENIANVDGNARPGQLIVDLETDPPQLYVGNNAGNITLVASGGGSSNKIFNGTSYANIAASNGNLEISVNSNTWTFGSDGNLTSSGAAGNITGANVVEANTFTSASGNLYIAPDSATPGAYLDIYLTGGPDVHIASTPGDNLILGTDTGANVTVGIGGQVNIQSYDSGNTASYTWTYGYLGTLQCPVVVYANLPSPTTPGLRAFVSDSNLAAATNFGATLTGGAGNTVPVWSDGTNWLIG